MNYRFQVNWIGKGNESYSKEFSSSFARQDFIEQKIKAGEIVKGECLVDRLDGHGYVYQYTFMA